MPSNQLIVLPSSPETSDAYSAADEEIGKAISLAQENLLRQQKPDGHWCGELLVDSTLCSDYVVFMHWSGEVDAQLQRRCVRHILKRQLPDGGWNIYHGGPSEINASVKAYFALKLAGCSVDAPFMQEARATIMRLGGIPQMNTFSKLYLALLGVFPWKYLPAIPVEMVLLPSWAPFYIYKMSSWSRAMLIPLSIINHFKPTRILPGEKQLHELYPLGTEQADLRLARSEKFWTWRNFFLRLDDTLKFLQPLRLGLLRQRALETAERWMLERIGEGSDGLAAVYPAMLNCMIALRSLGYSKTHPVYAKAEQDFTGLFVNDPDDFRIQPCLSPVWDTAITIISLADSGLSPRASRAAKGGRMAGQQGSANPGRLGGQQFVSRGQRLGVRVQQRLLRRHRRHRDGVNGAAACSTERFGVTEGIVSPCAWMAAQFPMSRRRMGGIR